MATSDTSSQDSLRYVQQHINDVLLVYCGQSIESARQISPLYMRLWQAIHSVAAAGGKRIRPYLVMQAYEGFGGQDTDAAFHVAASWELLHIGLLVHDDIIDRDFTRHGQPNVAGQLQGAYEQLGFAGDEARRYANNGALLAGDLLLLASRDFLQQSALLAPDQKTVALHHIQKATFAVVGGELMDAEASHQSLASVDALRIASLKTASYSMVGPLLTGAALARCSKAHMDLLRQFGEELGIGYQLLDDLLGVFGDSHYTGKSATSDLAEGKRTLLLKEAYERCDASDRQTINDLLEKPLRTEEDITALRSCIARSGARQVLERFVDDHRQQALELLEQLPMNTVNKNHLRWLVRYALSRTA